MLSENEGKTKYAEIILISCWDYLRNESVRAPKSATSCMWAHLRYNMQIRRAKENSDLSITCIMQITTELTRILTLFECQWTDH